MFIVLSFAFVRIQNVDSFTNDINQLKAVRLKTDSESDSKCQTHLDYFTAALEQRENWALESKKNF